MDTEVVLYYSPNFWGTADSICFRDNVLRIHDLKTGTGPIHEEQVLVYAALFCLEYKIRPGDIEMELRIYQNDDIDVCLLYTSPSPRDRSLSRMPSSA